MYVANKCAVQDRMYEMYPRIDEMKCLVHKIEDGPSLTGQKQSENRKLLQVKAPKLGFVSLLSILQLFPTLALSVCCLICI